MARWFNGPAFFVALREVLEACLIVALALAALTKTGATHLRRWVWIGAGAGVVVSAAFGGALAAVYYTRGDEILSGDAEGVFEGVAFIAAGALLTGMVLWALVQGAGKRSPIARRIDEMVAADADARAAPRRRGGWCAWVPAKARVRLAIATMIFVNIVREGVEVTIFVFGASSAEDGEGAAWQGAILPTLLAVCVGIGTAFAVFRGVIRFNLVRVMRVTSVLLVLFAGGLLTHGVRELQEVGWFGSFEDVDAVDRPWWNANLWSAAACCSASGNEFFGMLRALLGYQDTPTFLEFATYALYMLSVCAAVVAIHWTLFVESRDFTAASTRPATFAATTAFFFTWLYAVSSPTWTGILTTTLGLFACVAAAAAVLDGFTEYYSSLRPRRRAGAYAASIAMGAVTLLLLSLHIAQILCLERSCRLPPFYYWASIFSPAWLSSARTATSYPPLAALSVSALLTAALLGAYTVLLYLFAAHIDAAGAFIYDAARVKIDAPPPRAPRLDDSLSAGQLRRKGSADSLRLSLDALVPPAFPDRASPPASPARV